MVLIRAASLPRKEQQIEKYGCSADDLYAVDFCHCHYANVFPISGSRNRAYQTGKVDEKKVCKKENGEVLDLSEDLFLQFYW